MCVCVCVLGRVLCHLFCLIMMFLGHYTRAHTHTRLVTSQNRLCWSSRLLFTNLVLLTSFHLGPEEDKKKKVFWNEKPLIIGWSQFVDTCPTARYWTFRSFCCTILVLCRATVSHLALNFCTREIIETPIFDQWKKKSIQSIQCIYVWL